MMLAMTSNYETYENDIRNLIRQKHDNEEMVTVEVMNCHDRRGQIEDRTRRDSNDGVCTELLPGLLFLDIAISLGQPVVMRPRLTANLFLFREMVVDLFSFFAQDTPFFILLFPDIPV
jgi:hypothetical protein